MSRHRRAIGNVIAVVIICVACTAQTTLAPTSVPTATPAPTQVATQTEMPAPTQAATQTATQTPPPTALPTATAMPTQTPLPTATQPPPPTATQMPTPTPTWIPIPISDAYAVVGVALDDVLNVRAQAGVQHPTTSGIPPYGTGIQVTGGGVEVSGSLWVRIRYGENTGWVNSRYLATQVGWTDEAIVIRATAIIQAIKNTDLARLSELVHPSKGVRFSPYTYVRTEAEADPDLVFSAAKVASLATDQTVYRWGWFDGSGDPIDMTFEAYWARFIYDADFWQPHAVGYDEVIGAGNTINNIAQVYPQASVIEYHFTGFDPQYGGLDWRSLRLVLEGSGGLWYLVGVVHGEWTI